MALFFSKKKKVNTSSAKKQADVTADKSAAEAAAPDAPNADSKPAEEELKGKNASQAPAASEPEPGEADAAAKAAPEPEKSDAAAKAEPEPGKSDAAAKAAPEPEKSDAAAKAVSGPGESDTAAAAASEATEADGKPSGDEPEKKEAGAAPFIRSGASTAETMFGVIIALLPAAGFGVYSYGLRAAAILGISVASCVLMELLCSLILRGRGSVSDYSAIVTGMIGGLLLPADVPYYYPVILAAVAIIGAKWAFGGIGKNILNPAGTGKMVLLILFFTAMNDFTGGPYGDLTPLQQLASGAEPDLVQMLYGTVPGCIGTTSAAAILSGAVILFASGAADGIIPACCIAGFTVMHVMFGEHGLSPYYTAVELVSGGLLFTAFFMANDSTTSPVTRKGKVVYGLLMGAVCFVLRQKGFGDYAALIALLCMNVLSRALDAALLPSAGRKQLQRTIRVRSGKTMKNGMTAEELERILLSQSEADFEMFEKSVLPRNAAAGSETAGTINRKSIEAYQKRKRVTTRRRHENRAMTQDELAQALRQTAKNSIHPIEPLENKPAQESRFTSEYQQWLEQQMSALEQDTMRQLDVASEENADSRTPGMDQQDNRVERNAAQASAAMDENYEAYNGNNAYESRTQTAGWQQSNVYASGWQQGSQSVMDWPQTAEYAGSWQEGSGIGQSMPQGTSYTSGWAQNTEYASGWQQGAGYAGSWQQGAEYAAGWQQEQYGNASGEPAGTENTDTRQPDEKEEDPKKGSYLAAARRMGYGNSENNSVS